MAQATGMGKTNVITYITPDLYSFTMYPVSKTTTDCLNLNRLLESYAGNRCDSERPGLYCSSILAQIKTEQVLDQQSNNPLQEFARFYKINPIGNLPNPISYSKRFDIGYADSYDFSLKALEAPGTFHFEGAMTRAELDVENKIDADPGYEITLINDQRYLKLKSKIRVCALESGRISLFGKANMSVSTYHPVGRGAYDVVSDTYHEAIQIAARNDLNHHQKDFRLGLVAGKSLKRIESQIKGPLELDEIALSLQRVIMDQDQSQFKPVTVNADSNIAVKILDPGVVVPNAKIQIQYKDAL